MSTKIWVAIISGAAVIIAAIITALATKKHHNDGKVKNINKPKGDNIVIVNSTGESKVDIHPSSK